MAVRVPAPTRGGFGGWLSWTRLAPLVVLALGLCLLETLARLGARSPFTQYTLPAFSLGYFWDSPLGWTSLIEGTLVNRDALQFESLARFLRGEPDLLTPLDGIVYTRFSAYALLGTILAPWLGRYGGFVALNLLGWGLAVVSTYALGVRRTGSAPVAALAAVLVGTAPVFAALVGQPLPYVLSYGLFAGGAWYAERVGLFERDAPAARSVLVALVVGTTLLVYDLYMLPAFVVLYGLRRMSPRNLVLFGALVLLPRLAWSGWWSAENLVNYTQNQEHPLRSLLAWLQVPTAAGPLGIAAFYGKLAAHVAVNILAVFMVVPVALAGVALLAHGGLRDRDWYVAVLLGGFGPAAFMVSTWPHVPRWYAYGFPAIYLLTAIALLDLAGRVARRWSTASPSTRPTSGARTLVLALALAAPVVALANLDLLGFSRPMELLLFQPEHWSYLWRW